MAHYITDLGQELLGKLAQDDRAKIDAIWRDPALSFAARCEKIATLAANPQIAAIARVFVTAPGLPLYESDRMAINRALSRAARFTPPVGAAVSPTAAPLPQPTKAAGGRRPARPAPRPDEGPDPSGPQSEPEQGTAGPAVWADPEMGRVARGLKRDSEFRIWAILKKHSAARGGRLDKLALYGIVLQDATDYTRRHFNRLIAAGRGLFWFVDDTADGAMIRLRGSESLAGELTRLAYAMGRRGLVTTAPVGRRDMLIPVGDNLQAWRANLYGAWVSGREGVMMARETIAELWGVDDDTLRNWEAINPRIKVRANWEQTPMTAADIALLGDAVHAVNPSTRYFHTWNGELIRFQQLVNSYTAYGYQQAGRKGKTKRRRNACMRSNPGYSWTAGQLDRLYFENADALRRRNRRAERSSPGLVFRGESRFTGRRIWENTASDPRLGPDARARGDVANRHASAALLRRRMIARTTDLLVQNSQDIFSTPNHGQKCYCVSGEDFGQLARSGGQGRGARGGNPTPRPQTTDTESDQRRRRYTGGKYADVILS